MTATANLDLPALIHKLARIHDDEQLEQLTLDWANDCRGLPEDAAQLFTATELFRVSCVTKALVTLCGFAAADVLPAVRSQLLHHPRRESALSLIDEYAREADAARTLPFNKLQHERGRSEGNAKLLISQQSEI